jgi:hypothetical protein
MRIYPVWVPWAGFISSPAFVLYQLATFVLG